MTAVPPLGGFVLWSEFAGIIEGIPRFCPLVTILATGRPRYFFMAVDAGPVHCSFEAWRVMVIAFRIPFLYCRCGKRVNQMATLA